jgi:hypothetical protein
MKYTKKDYYELSGIHGEAKAYGIVMDNELYGERLKFLIPSHMIGGICRWVLFGIMPGSFLSAVLRNDLFQACRNADDHNADRLKDYVMFFSNYTPIGSYGSSSNVDHWNKAGGVIGRIKHAGD